MAIVAATLTTYANVRYFDFINFDDRAYPLNRNLRGGISLEAAKWAFTTGEQGNWHPLTWLSHLLDIQLYGPQGGPHHVTNVILHVLASAMLFVFLRRATGARWRSAFVSFLFALHPLHVESVAWVSERKDVLCAFFWFLTSWTYVRYAERPSLRRYLIVFLPFCLGLLSKPMIVTLPLVLLLLDFWPLGRALSIRLLLEKIPFVALAGVDSFITFLVQQQAGYIRTTATYPVGLRIENALVSYLIYIGKMFWPVDLPVWYPYPKSIPVRDAVVAALVIAAVSALALRGLRKFPYVASGWFWYLGTLVPVIGLIQVGRQSRADRYMYIPMVGLSIVLAWAAADIANRWPRGKTWIVSVLAGACLAMIPDTWIELQYWENTEKLFTHAIRVSKRNDIGYHNVGAAMLSSPARYAEALKLFDAELLEDPQSAQAHCDRGTALASLDRRAEAAAEFHTALALNPGYKDAHLEYGAMLLDEGDWRQAIVECEAALRLDPRNSRALENRGVALAAGKYFEKAIASYDSSLQLEPDNFEAHTNLGKALAALGHVNESLLEFDEAIRLNAGYVDAHRNRGVALLKTGRRDEAVASFQTAVRLSPQYAESRYSLGTALMGMPGQTSEAVEQLREAVRLDPALAGAQRNLARLLALNTATLPEAIAHVNAAMQVDPTPATHQLLQKLKSQTLRR